jgi:hypothetical protein
MLIDNIPLAKIDIIKMNVRNQNSGVRIQNSESITREFQIPLNGRLSGEIQIFFMSPFLRGKIRHY